MLSIVRYLVAALTGFLSSLRSKRTVASPSRSARKWPAQSGQRTRAARVSNPPAKSKAKSKHSVVLPTTVAPLHKVVKQSALEEVGVRGKQPATPAPRTRQRAKPARKPKP